MVQLYSDRVSPAPPYSNNNVICSCTGLSPSSDWFSKQFHSALRHFRARPRSLATTCGITIVLFSSGYLDVSVPRVAPHCWVVYLQYTGFPHSDICGSKFVCNSPQLFAAYHVLRHLHEPRHPPYAFLSFQFLLDRFSFLKLLKTLKRQSVLTHLDLSFLTRFLDCDFYYRFY